MNFFPKNKIKPIEKNEEELEELEEEFEEFEELEGFHEEEDFFEDPASSGDGNKVHTKRLNIFQHIFLINKNSTASF